MPLASLLPAPSHAFPLSNWDPLYVIVRCFALLEFYTGIMQDVFNLDEFPVFFLFFFFTQQTYFVIDPCCKYQYEINLVSFLSHIFSCKGKSVLLVTICVLLLI